MKDRILHFVKDFLQRRWRSGAPLLVAVSGGPDSLALLHLLLESRRFFPLDLHIAHVDHGWRKESSEEADALRRLAGNLEIPFHLKRLEPPTDLRNLEGRAREQRCEYFAELYLQEGAQALLLGHQADDQAETVLKRLLEGSGLPALGGLKEESFLEGMCVWRPLISLCKKELEEWLDKRGLTAFQDPTNCDPRFLRARMRSNLLPILAEEFGKEASLNLARLGRTAVELDEYLERKIAPHLASVIEEPEGITVDLTRFLPMEKIEFTTLCRKMAGSMGGYFSREILEKAYLAIKKKAPNRRFLQRGQVLIADRGCLKIFKESKFLRNNRTN